VPEFVILWIDLSPTSSGVVWDQNVFYERVQFIKQNIRQDWAHNAALWNSTQRLGGGPVFQVSCIKKVLQQFEKSSIVNMLFEYFQE